MLEINKIFLLKKSIESWSELCVAIDKKFGRDMYQNYTRSPLGIKQTTTILGYAKRFNIAKHRVLVHNPSIDGVFFFQKFLDGLNIQH